MRFIIFAKFSNSLTKGYMEYDLPSNCGFLAVAVEGLALGDCLVV